MRNIDQSELPTSSSKKTYRGNENKTSRRRQIKKIASSAASGGKGWQSGFLGLFFMQLVGMIPGIIVYILLVTHEPFSGVTYEDIPGFTTGITVVGSGLSFLLVFRLNWSFNRWWESRSMLGSATTQLRDLCSNVTTGTFNFAILDGNISDFTPSPKMDALAQLELDRRRQVAHRDAQTRCNSHARKDFSKSDRLRSAFVELCCLDVYWAAKGWFGILVDTLKDKTSMLDYESHLDSSMTTFGKMVEKGHHASAWPAPYPPKNNYLPPGDHRCQRLLLAHSLLSSSVRRAFEAKLLIFPEYQKALSQLEGTLKDAFGCIKVKTEPIPTPMTFLSLALLVSYTLLFPIYMAYYFVAKLSSEALDDKFGFRFFPVLMYVLTTMLVLLFFSALRFIARQMDDPFGEDPFDIKLIQMRNALWGDIDSLDAAMTSVYDGERKKADNSFLFQAKDEGILVDEADNALDHGMILHMDLDDRM